MIFFVVRPTFKNETNLSIFKHLQYVFQISTGGIVEICETAGVLREEQIGRSQVVPDRKWLTTFTRWNYG